MLACRPHRHLPLPQVSIPKVATTKLKSAACLPCERESACFWRRQTEAPHTHTTAGHPFTSACLPISPHSTPLLALANAAFAAVDRLCYDIYIPIPPLNFMATSICLAVHKFMRSDVVLGLQMPSWKMHRTLAKYLNFTSWSRTPTTNTALLPVLTTYTRTLG